MQIVNINVSLPIGYICQQMMMFARLHCVLILNSSRSL